MLCKHNLNLSVGKMASIDHVELANFIKSVHKQLRNESNNVGLEKAWINHCNNSDKLSEYAVAMEKLAKEHWKVNSEMKENVVSRVEWIHNYCQQYFFTQNIIEEKRLHETEIATKINLSFDDMHVHKSEPRQLKLLDVGSCYNPFGDFNYKVTPIDIAPAREEVFKCDFLNVELGSCLKLSSNFIVQLPFNYFDVVVFSLYLEYLPSPSQRHLSCTKAYDLLKPEGLLMIVTPDSKHVGANAKYMKTWRYILAKMGFSRIKYEKFTHIHCMAFRKSLKREIASRWSDLHENAKFFDDIVVPQDFNTLNTK